MISKKTNLKIRMITTKLGRFVKRLVQVVKAADDDILIYIYPLKVDTDKYKRDLLIFMKKGVIIYKLVISDETADIPLSEHMRMIEDAKGVLMTLPQETFDKIYNQIASLRPGIKL